jgi:DNA-binding XRE family transcriptional regulator
MPKSAAEAKERTKLIQARERLGLNRVEFAKKVGTSRVNVYRIEIGVSHPSLALMQRWVKALKLGPGVSLEMFWAAGAKARPSRRRAATPISNVAA